MNLSNITDRGTLRGVIYRGAGSGTTDYTLLTNKPQINGHTLQGNQSGDDLDLIDKGSLEINEHTLEGSMTGDDLGLINSTDLKFNVGYAGNILHNIKYKNDTYTTYAAPFSGASSGANGTMGLVPAPLSSQEDYDKFLKGNGHWASPYYNYKTIEEYTGEKWIDGSPVYRKVFDFSGSPFQLTRNAWTAVPAVYIDNMNTLLEVTMSGYDTANVYPATDQGCSKRFINGTLNYFLNIDFRIYVTAIIVKYTKHI